ncbi:DUF6442 family protein [Candidatus Stoquefichus massiliensis]|uniref:DUF6442 family protein n=1 Tax=Candidatus Stoquefichus massiliensis TaxID=1470350 RepID=UPI0004815008|nr:DUF6442 family protein [Candidatus Stoquefichus massiliensis]
MNKDEILNKAKKRKATDLDEREMQIMLKADRLAVIAGFIICIILMTVKMIAGQPYYDVYGIGCMLMGCQNLYFGLKVHNKSNILLGIGWTSLSVLITVVYIIDVLG